MPEVINGLDYPQSNRPFSHNIRRISNHPVPSDSAVTPIFKTQHPILIQARDRYFQSASITKKVNHDFCCHDPVITKPQLLD